MSDPRRLARALLGPSVVPLGGGFSGETFRADVDGEDVVLRLHLRQPDRAAVDVALLRRLRGVVPVPAVLDARVAADGGHPAYVLMQHLPGRRLDEVLDEAADPVCHELGRAVGGVLLRLRTVTFARPGLFAGPDLAPRPFPAGLADLEAWARAHLDRGGLAAWTAEDRHALLAGCRGTRPLIGASGGAATLVHSDFNPKNLLVDPDRAEVTGLLDWEFAHAGHPLTDLGNLLRFPPRRWEPGLRALTGGVLELLGAAGLPSGWLETARALDLFALVELAARERRNPVVDRARELLLATARTGSLAAGRPTPRAGRL